MERRKHELQGRQVLKEPGKVELLSVDGKENPSYREESKCLVMLVEVAPSRGKRS